VTGARPDRRERMLNALAPGGFEVGKSTISRLMTSRSGEEEKMQACEFHCSSSGTQDELNWRPWNHDNDP
jgi:hypothetical protein